MKTEVKQQQPQQQQQQQQRKEQQPILCNKIPDRNNNSKVELRATASPTFRFALHKKSSTFLKTSPSTTSTASSQVPPTAITAKPKKSCTAFLCELTRLKSQQKYLECNQYKLIPSNFEDEDEDSFASAAAVGVAATSSSEGMNDAKHVDSSTKPTVRQFIADIEQLKLVLENDLNEYSIAAKNEVQDLWILVNAVRDDVFQSTRLQMSSMRAIRERIISINSQLTRLVAKNAKELSDLQRDYERMHDETKLLIK